MIESPRDELLLGILLVLVGGLADMPSVLELAVGGAGVVVGVGSYLRFVLPGYLFELLAPSGQN